MPRIHLQQHSFVSGVLSPEMRGRVDFPRYHAGMLQGKNVLIAPSGGARKRPGTRFVDDLGPISGGDEQRLVPFEFSVTDAYALSFREVSSYGTSRMEVYRAGVGLVAPAAFGAYSGLNNRMTGNITGWTDNSTGTATISHDAVNDRLNLNVTNGNTAIATEQATVINLNVTHSFGITIFPHAPGHAYECNSKTPGVTLKLGNTGPGSTEYLSKFFTVGYHVFEYTPTLAQLDVQIECDYDPAAGTYTIGIDNVGPYVREAVSIETPYDPNTSGKTLDTLRFTQVADVVYLLNSEVPAHQLKRLAHTDWSLEPVPWIDGPYLDANDTTTTLGTGATTGRRVTVTASAITGINKDTGFQSTDVGRLLRKANNNTPTAWGYGIITEVTDTTHVEIDIIGTMPNNTAVTAWQLGAWSEGEGYPQIITQHEQRLVAARTTSQPTTVWGTASLGYTDYTPGTNAADAKTFNVQAGGQNAAMWMKSIGDVLIGSASDEILMDQASDQTFGDALPVVQTSEGSSFIDAISIAGAVLFVQRTGRRLRELAFRFEQGADGGYRTADLSILSDHLTNAQGAAGAAKKITEIHYQPERDPIVWCLLDDGVVLALTYARDQEVVAWTEGIVLRSGDTVKSMCVLPVSGGYEVWLVTHRVRTGATRVGVERMTFGWLLADDAWYVDFAKEHDGAAVGSFSTTSWLGDGDVVAVWAEGGAHPSVTVASSLVTFEREYTHAIMGLPYTPTIETMPLASAEAPIRDKHKSYGRARVNLYNSQAVKVGGKKIPARRGTDEFTTAPPLLTGIYEIPVDGWSKDLTLTITQDEFSAAPMTVLSYMAPVEVSDE